MTILESSFQVDGHQNHLFSGQPPAMDTASGAKNLPRAHGIPSLNSAFHGHGHGGANHLPVHMPTAGFALPQNLELIVRQNPTPTYEGCGVLPND